MIVIDEVFGEFAPQLSAVNLLGKYKNLIILRGFSKSYALAGIRLGYILTSTERINELSEKTTWSNVSYLSCGAAAIALKHEEFYQNLRTQTMKRKGEVVKGLEQLGYVVAPSHINTIALKFSDEAGAKRFVQKLRQEEIFVNWGEGDGKVGIDKTFVSFAVGTQKQIERLLEVANNIH